MSDTPVIYIVDDDQNSRDSVGTLVSQMSLKVEKFTSAEEFLRAYRGHRPACLLTDHRMLGMTGVELLEKLRAIGITLAVIVMTAFAETDLTVRAMRSGAVTLLEKPFSNSKLLDAINAAIAEDRSQHAQETLTRKIALLLDSLTQSELEVLKLMSNGETNKAIAFAMDVSTRTVENRRSSIFEKMKVSSVAEVIRLVMIARPELCE